MAKKEQSVEERTEKPITSLDERDEDCKRKKTGKVLESNADKAVESKQKKGPPNDELSNAGDNVVTNQKKGQPNEEPSNAGHIAASK